MTQVFIRTRAFEDPRLAELGRMVRMNAAAVGWKLAHTWSCVLDKERPLMAVDMVAMCIGRRADVVRRGLLGVGLAREHDARTLDLQPLTELFADSPHGDDLDDASNAARAATQETIDGTSND